MKELLLYLIVSSIIKLISTKDDCTLFTECKDCDFCGNLTQVYSSCNFYNIFCEYPENKNYEYNRKMKSKYIDYFRSDSAINSFCGRRNILLKSMEDSFSVANLKINSNLLTKSLHCDYEIRNLYYYEHESDKAKLSLQIKSPNENNRIQFNLILIYATEDYLRFQNLNDTQIRFNGYSIDLKKISDLEILIDFKNNVNGEEYLEIGIETENPSKKIRIIYIIVLSICGVLLLAIIILIILYIIIRKKINRIEESRRNEEIEREEKIKKNKKIIEYLLENDLKAKIFTKDIVVNDCEKCSICLEAFECDKSQVSITPCKHIFHFDCLKNWLETEALNPQCPNCKYSILSNVDLNSINLNDNNGNNNIRNGNPENCSEHVVIHNVRNLENNNGQSNNNGNN
jgi:hypothetical protein